MSARRTPLVGRHTREELALAARNRGMPLEALRYDVTTAAVVRVEFNEDGVARDTILDQRHHQHAWQGWRTWWDAKPGEHELSCRATDADGNRQPLEPPWDLSGFGNNAVQRIGITVR